MVLDDVADGAGLVVVAGALADALLLRDGDQDRLHQGAVPDRLEERVGEAEREHVLDGVLGQVVVDAEDLLFLERRGELGVQLLRRSQVVAQRLFDHDPARIVLPGREAGFAERGDDVAEKVSGGVAR